MNKERILQLADAIENDTLPEGMFLNMTVIFGDYAPPCGCLIGATVALFEGIDVVRASYNDRGDDNIVERAAELLGLDPTEGYITAHYRRLFFPTDGRWAELTSADAVATLRRFVETGEVVW